MRISLRIVFMFSVFSLLFSFCTYEKEDLVVPNKAITDSVSYKKTIKRIVELRCYVGADNNNCCHNGAGCLGGADLSDYIGMTNYSGKRLSDAINHRSGALPMPRGTNGKMPQAEIDSIDAWINQGFLDN